jgi:hypothetical protein
MYLGEIAPFDPPAELLHDFYWVNLPSNVKTDHDDQQRDNVSFDVSHVLHLGGTHSLKAGVQNEHLTNDVLSGSQQPVLRFFWGQAGPHSDAQGTYGGLDVEMEITQGLIESDSTALFFQDSWSAGRLTVNAGLRAERETIPFYFDRSLGFPKNAIEFDWSDKLAPRLGFALDLRGDARWKAYGTYGDFYDRVKLGHARQAFGGYRDVYYAFRLNTLDWREVSCSGINALPNDQPTCTNAEFVGLHPYAVIGGVADMVVPDIRPPQSREWSFGMDHQLRWRHSIGVRFVHRELVRALDSVGIGAAKPLGNPGEGAAEFPAGSSFPAFPKAVRDYDAFEIETTVQPTSRIWAHASYVHSRLWGNYSGTVSTDDFGTSNPSGSPFADTLISGFDVDRRAVYGPLSTDRTHRFKAQVSAEFPWRLNAGLNQSFATGTPVSTEVTVNRTPFYPYGRGDMGRTPSISQTDMFVARTFALSRQHAVELSVNVMNLFDQDEPLAVFSRPTLFSINTTNAAFFGGTFDFETALAKQKKNPQYGKPAFRQAAREVRVGARLTF